MLASEDDQPRASTSVLNPQVLACFDRWERDLDALDAPQRVSALTVLCDVGPQQLGHPRLVQLAMLWSWSKRQPLQLGVLQDAEPTLWSPDAQGLSALSMARSARHATDEDLARWLHHLDESVQSTQVIILSAQALGDVSWRYHIQQPARLSEPLSVALWQGDSLVDRVMLEPPQPDEVLCPFGQLYVHAPAHEPHAPEATQALKSVRFGGDGTRIIALTQEDTLKAFATPMAQAQSAEALSFKFNDPSMRPVALGWLGRAPLTLMLDAKRQELSLWRGETRWLTLSEDLPSLERLALPSSDELPELVVGRGYHTRLGKRWAVRFVDGQLLSGFCEPSSPVIIDPTPVRSIAKMMGQLWQLNELDRAPQKPKDTLDAVLLERLQELVLDHTKASPDQLRALVPARHHAHTSGKPPIAPLHLALPVLRMSAPRVAAMLIDRDGQPKLAAQINARWCWSGSLVVAHWQDRFLFELPPSLHVIGVMPSARCAEELGFIALDEPTRTKLWFAGRRFERLLWQSPERICAVCLDTTTRRVLLTGTSGRRWLVSSHLGELLWTGQDIL